MSRIKIGLPLGTRRGAAAFSRAAALFRALLVALLATGLVAGNSALAAPASVANPRLLEVKRTSSFGGNGGGPFEISCPYGTVMTGLKARHGAWIDAVSPICAKFVNGRVLGEIPHEIFTGGRGGGPGFMRCQGPRGVVTGLQMFKADNEDGSVGHIIIECGDYLNPASFNNKLPGSADYLGKATSGGRVTVRCTPPLVAGGVFGRSGAYIDRIGLSCVNYQPRQ